MMQLFLKSFRLRKKVVQDIFLLTLVFGLLFFAFLGTRPLSAPDEGRYTEIPREMVESGDYVTPRLNGVKYFEKPPLVYWLGALSIKIFGVKEWAMRLWPALFSLLGCLLVYGVGMHLYGRRAGFISATALGSSLYYYAHSQIIIIDSTVSFLMTVSLLAFFMAQKSQQPAKRLLYQSGFFIAMGLGVLAKGLIGAVLPGLVILVWACLTQSWRSLLMAFNPWGILTFFAVVAPWHILASIKNPEFPYFYFIHEHFLRYTTTVHGRKKFPGFFVPILLLGWYPWVALLPHVIQKTVRTLKENFRSDPDLVFFSTWIGVIFLFFSFSNSQLIPYIHPIFAPIALILGRFVDQSWSNTNNLSFERALKGLITISWLMAILIPIVLYRFELPMPFMLTFIVGMVMLMLIIGPLLIYYAYHKRQFFGALTAIALFSLTLNVLLTAAWPYLEDRSVKPIALYLLEHKKQGDLVVCYNRYYQDLPPYLGEKVMVVNWQGELEFGMQQENTKSWMIDEESFWKLWTKQKKMYMVTRKVILEKLDPQHRRLLHPVLETQEDVLVTNME
ncbi:MAG: glycosyltransferase family 39 protein [Alphaproteobacteria bacterium]|nr:glycosyltransferase family 39 protein [Alphaproteobacteria bacterium]